MTFSFFSFGGIPRLSRWFFKTTEPAPPIAPAPLEPSVKSALLELQRIKDLPPEQIQALVNTAAKDPSLSYGERSHLTAINTLGGAGPRYHQAIFSERIDADADTTTVALPAGIMSGDQSSILGRRGYFFLLRGTNNLLAEYCADRSDPVVQVNAGRWLDLFERRRNLLHERGVRYVQTILPEKATVLPHLIPLVLTTPTATLSLIEDGIARSPTLAPLYVSGREILANHATPDATFLKVDSHFTPYGTWVMFDALMKHMGFDVGEPPTFDKTRAKFGDLGGRFFEISFLDIVNDVSSWPLDRQFMSEAILTFENNPPSGHIGHAQSWENPNAPIDATLLTFGNSFFGPANNQQNSMSWWFARWFKRYHYVWHPFLLPNLVDKVKPDIVICQSIERFLPEVPPH